MLIKNIGSEFLSYKTATAEQIGLLLGRRHPTYDLMVDHWEFLLETYTGGRAWFDKHIFKYLKEGDKEFKDRVKRAYRFNHSREVVDLVNKYVFKGKIRRNEKDAPTEIVDFWDCATRGGKNIESFMRFLSKQSSILGRVWVVVDAINRGSGESKAEAKPQIYAYSVIPQNVLDMSFDEDENLNWILIREVFRDDENPLSNSSNRQFYRYRLWTRNTWHLFKEDNPERKKNEKIRFAFVEEGEHGLGVVPVFPVDHMESEELYHSPSMIGDVAYLDRTCANYLSNLDAIIQDQTFSQLAIPAQGLMPGEDGHRKVIEAGTKRIFTFDGEGGQPFFLSPDPKQAELIITSIRQIINEIYVVVGVNGERTKQDNAQGIDNSSGVAKAYDFERVNSLLVNKSKGLEQVEYNLVDLVMRYHGVKDYEPPKNESGRKTLIAWPTDFDTRGLHDELDISSRLEALTTPIEIKRYQLKQVLDKLYPFISDKDRKELTDSIEQMTDDLTDQIGKTFGINKASEEPVPNAKIEQAESEDKENGRDTDQE